MNNNKKKTVLSIVNLGKKVTRYAAITATLAATVSIVAAIAFDTLNKKQ